MYRVEFHVHTSASHDSILTYPFIKLMCKLKKINCLAICDHNEIKGAVKYQKKLKKDNIEVIIGEEILTSDGEIIGLFLTKKIKPFMSAKETIKEIKKQNGLVYIPHPYEPYRSKTVLKEKCISENAKEIDLIEVHNGRNRDLDISSHQLEIANKYNLRKVIGSDAHTFFELGRNSINLSSISKDKILKSIEKNDIISKKKAIKFAHIWTKVARLLKLMRVGDFNELFRIIKQKCRRKK